MNYKKLMNDFLNDRRNDLIGVRMSINNLKDEQENYNWREMDSALFNIKKTLEFIITELDEVLKNE